MEINVFYGTETGNSETLASSSAKALAAAGFNASSQSLEGVSVEDLSKLSNVLIITSTWGDGEPPSNATDIHQELATTSKSLAGLNYAVLGIGQSFYDNFCQTAKDFDEYLIKAGAKKIVEIELCDDDFDDKFPEWIAKIVSSLNA